VEDGSRSQNSTETGWRIGRGDQIFILETTRGAKRNNKRHDKRGVILESKLGKSEKKGNRSLKKTNRWGAPGTIVSASKNQEGNKGGGPREKGHDPQHNSKGVKCSGRNGVC